ncbi:RNA ligase family protein [Bacillus toyonensis]|uniref:RNA ligase family protein n=1 Tax=Bacillus toyonensis TaxID=155322 RepID=UPI002E229C3C|nr:RNA ligase family protein [Bacillus toyonensis]
MLDYRKLNSITKYPSILTYHKITGKGRLLEERVETSIFDAECLINVYEKINGENSRVVFLGDGSTVDYFIGSREELLLAKGDRIGNTIGNIANYFTPIADELCLKLKGFKGLIALYFESYGGITPHTKQYSSDKTQNGRLFDVFALSQEEVDSLLEMPLSKIAGWRDRGNQPFYDCVQRMEFANKNELQVAPLLTSIKGKDLPTDVKGVSEWLEQFRETRVGINAAGRSEGVICRTTNREVIAKLRIEEYDKTLKDRN